ncbi:MAG: prenyltransferase [Cyanobacteria bacterium SIG28]|nr:prenyltransferase [Cyanobacteria bacterium SIG28]
MLQKTLKLLYYSRAFSLPMSILSWMVVFTFGVVNSGNILYGIIALLGICLAHLGTNVLDDYLDYKSLIKQVDFNKEEYLKQSQKTKCRYIINGMVTEKKVLLIALKYFLLAFICGLFLFIKCGIGVFYFAMAGGLIALLYSPASRICLSELMVALAYGPILFGGVYYVMTGVYAKEAFLMCIPTMILTVVLVYIHTVMDYEFDTNENKCTIANRFDSQLDSLVVLKFLLIFAYLSVILLCVFDILDWQVFFVYLTIPLSVDFYKSMINYSCMPDSVPEKKWYHFPMENLETLKQNGEAGFMIRMYQSRNLMVYFSILLVISIILSLWV